MENGPPSGWTFRECILEETVLGQVCWALPLEAHSDPVNSQSPLSRPSLAQSIGCFPAPPKTPTFPILTSPVPLQDYIHSTHGKEMDLLRTTVKVPGKRPPRAISACGPSASINGLVKDMSTVQMGEGPGESGS